MVQNTRNRLVAPGLASPTRLEALVFEPWNDVTAQMNRLVSTVLPADVPAAAGDPELAWVPAVDVEEREDGLRLAFEIPGVDPEALVLTVDDRVLTVGGERTFARSGNGTERDAYRLERRYGRFSRSLRLPPTVDPDRIQARAEHGVLYLEVPKRPEAKPRRIAVATAPGAASAGDRRPVDPGAAEA